MLASIHYAVVQESVQITHLKTQKHTVQLMTETLLSKIHFPISLQPGIAQQRISAT